VSEKDGKGGDVYYRELEINGTFKINGISSIEVRVLKAALAPRVGYPNLYFSQSKTTSLMELKFSQELWET